MGVAKIYFQFENHNRENHIRPHTLKPHRHLIATIAVAASFSAMAGGELIFQDRFQSKLAEGWNWRREHPGYWRTTNDALEIRLEPGNMWGPANNGKNVLFRPAPGFAEGPLEISVKVDISPTHQYEQADLVWYYDDSNMVKIGHELVDGKLSIVMGREENDKTRTLAIIPFPSSAVELRHVVETNRIRGFYRAPGGQWKQAGECGLPVHGPPQISLQCYQGEDGVEHWARFSDFQIRRFSP